MAALPGGESCDRLGHITGTAVLEFGPAETLPLVGAMSPVYPVSADRAPLPWPAHPREKPGFSTSARYFPSETDCLLEGNGFELSVPRCERNESRSGTGTVTEATKVRLEAVAYLPGTDGSNSFPSSEGSAASGFCACRVPGSVTGQNNSSLQRVEGSAQRGLIRSI